MGPESVINLVMVIMMMTRMMIIMTQIMFMLKTMMDNGLFVAGHRLTQST